eukprot:TRINITY_DN1973_c0_g1_i1.p1 TRINITY_DN1973_c0_g1~~TRINITY_DN1973_c0_g1_i1.p1  ORF type:complete len:619 (-),score=149.34 TRINITY_DN1973_c0_g1_i1:305-2161(-)
MVVDSKARLTAMLDADLERADALGAEVVAIAEKDKQNGFDRPTTFSEWFQIASADDIRSCLKSLVAEQTDVAGQVGALLEEERAHQAWVLKEEQAWKAQQQGQTPEADLKQKENQKAATSTRKVDLERQACSMPLRLSAGERGLLGILEGALYVSEYTDRVDVYHTGSKARRMALQIQQVCAILAGLVVANNLDVARRPLTERSFVDNQHFFRAVFEIGRRYKILNPDKMRGGYGKLVHMLQDSVKDEVVRSVGFECVNPIRTVASLLHTKRRGADLLDDPLLVAATQEIYEVGKSREQVATEVREKNEALVNLRRKYADEALGDEKAHKVQRVGGGHLAQLLQGRDTTSELLSEEEIDLIVSSVSDHFAFQRYNREPCERMLQFLREYFDPASDGGWSLEIFRGRGGSCLTNNHRTQYTFVMQSLLLWREIMGNMFALWQATEDDLLDPMLRYRLTDTGQGLNRMQAAPRVSRMMSSILGKVQSEVGGWVGLSVVHLGDRDVPNALVFIDKYTQVPRILGPLVKTLDRLPDIYKSPAIAKLIDAEFGSLEALRMTILQDFFRHGFDGSGDDGGSCVDGRLTSCWNWCSKVEKKKYFQAFLLTGFTGFDGGFEGNGMG